MRGYELTDRGKILIAVILVLLILVIPSAIIALGTVSDSAQPSDTPNNSQTGTDSQSPPAAETQDPSAEPEAYQPQTPPENVTENPALETPDSNPSDSPVPNEPDSTPSSEPSVMPPDESSSPPSTKPDASGQPDPKPSNKPDSSASGSSGVPLSNKPDASPTAQTPLESSVADSTGVRPEDGGKLSFIFFPRNQKRLDAATLSKLNSLLKTTYLPNYVVTVETPQMSAKDMNTLKSILNAALIDRGVSEDQIEYISFPPIETSNSVDIQLYFVSRTEK